jgi:lipopolysaccharide/colanic/teichoic acid biosynthesis glycosyltransferase
LAASPAQRFFDVVIACGLLLISTPLLIGIALLTRITSAGPVFYCQDRVGRGGTTFRIFKFRTMRVDAESTSGPVWAVDQDPRCTPLGGWLRRLCLDELPQLLNVLRGEMSLVGPRPERPYFVAQFRRRFPLYDYRHSVKPGITGWAQVNGWRGNTSVQERLRFDLDYVWRRSLVFDVRILLRTPATLLFPRSPRELRDAQDLQPLRVNSPLVAVAFSPDYDVGVEQRTLQRVA